MPGVGSFFDSPPITPPSRQIPEQDQSACEQVRDALLADKSQAQYLSALGQNYGIRRPDVAPSDDEIFRRVFQAIACPGPKTSLSTLYFLLEAVFGSQASYVSLSQRPWRVYEVNPVETIIEIPYELIATDNETASYLHGFSGVVLDGATTTVLSFSGNALEAASSLVGLGISVFISGVWEEQTILTATYDEAVDETEVEVASAYSGTPDPGAAFFITVPGDEVSSFRGDYISPTWRVYGESTSVGVNSLVDSGLSLTPNEFAGQFLRLADGKIHYPILSHDATTFTLGANGAVPPAGFYAVVLSPNDALEESDGDDTPPHDDRIYVQGYGKAEIVRQYVLEVLKPAGVVVRFEFL